MEKCLLISKKQVKELDYTEVKNIIQTIERNDLFIRFPEFKHVASPLYKVKIIKRWFEGLIKEVPEIFYYLTNDKIEGDLSDRMFALLTLSTPTTIVHGDGILRLKVQMKRDMMDIIVEGTKAEFLKHSKLESLTQDEKLYIGIIFDKIEIID